MNVVIHKQIDAFEKIVPDWETLKDGFHEITVFQDINWIKSWWVYKGKQSKVIPYIVEIKEGDETIGIIPLYITNKLIFRVLKPIGSDFSDYCLPILSKKYPPNQLLSLALEAVYKDKLSWDYIEWRDVPKDSFFAQFLNNQPLKKSTFISKKEGAVCPYLTLNGDFESLKSKFSQKFLKGILYNERKLKREGELKYNRVMTEQEIEPIMNKFFELHCERWGNTDTPSRFRNKEERDNTMLAAKNLFKSNLLYLAYMSHNNEIVVVHFGMSDGKRNYLYLHSINIKYKKYSPGNLLVYYLILESCKEGYEIVDFLRGDEDYKQKWGTMDKFNENYIIFNRSIKSRVFKSIYHTTSSNRGMINHLKPLAKRLLAKSVEQ